jgi:hypothetical protein
MVRWACVTNTKDFALNVRSVFAASTGNFARDVNGHFVAYATTITSGSGRAAGTGFFAVPSRARVMFANALSALTVRNVASIAGVSFVTNM